MGYGIQFQTGGGGGVTSKNSISKHVWHSIPMFTTDMNVDIEC